jgi:hypothetical protein
LEVGLSLKESFFRQLNKSGSCTIFLRREFDEHEQKEREREERKTMVTDAMLPVPCVVDVLSFPLSLLSISLSLF